MRCFFGNGLLKIYIWSSAMWLILKIKKSPNSPHPNPHRYKNVPARFTRYNLCSHNVSTCNFVMFSHIRNKNVFYKWLVMSLAVFLFVTFLNVSTLVIMPRRMVQKRGTSSAVAQTRWPGTADANPKIWRRTQLWTWNFTTGSIWNIYFTVY